jgi:drug/metabolite transporter (DMT)-like permease
MKKGNAARIMMAVSMLIYGTLAPLVRRIGVSSGELALYRAVMAAVTVGGFLLLTGRKLCLGEIKKELLLLTVSGAAMGVNWILLFEAYKYTTVSVATLSYYFAPIIVTALSPLLFKEKPTAKQVLCFAMATLGLCLITGAAGGGREDGTGIAFALGAAVLRMVAVSEPFYGVSIILEGVLQGIGDTVTPFKFNLLGMWGVRIVGTLICTRFLAGTLAAAWGCMIAHNMLLFVLFVIFYRTGRWNPFRHMAKQNL